MVEVNIRDKNFGGETSACHKGTNRHVKWNFTNTPVSNTCFLTDMCLQDIHKASGVKRKVAWLLEPKAIFPSMYVWIEKNNKLFDYVLTYDEYLLGKGENYLPYAPGMCWINNYVEEDKENKISIIASSKNSTEGHQLRHRVISDIKNLDAFGRVYNPIDSKEEALSKYMFSVTIENSKQPGYWTEKIVDCFATKTIPIYWGDNAVCDFFNKDGIIFFKTIDELKSIVENLSEEEYRARLDAVESNFKLVNTYRIPEDGIYAKYPFLFN